jgi:hypothetical protein
MDVFTEWMSDYALYGVIEAPLYQPQLFRLPTEILDNILIYLDTPDKTSLCFSCRSAHHRMKCECCGAHPCRVEIRLYLDYLEDWKNEVHRNHTVLLNDYYGIDYEFEYTSDYGDIDSDF